MAGGNTAGCRGGNGASNWGWIRVNACFFTPSLSYSAMACRWHRWCDCAADQLYELQTECCSKPLGFDTKGYKEQSMISVKQSNLFLVGHCICTYKGVACTVSYYSNIFVETKGPRGSCSEALGI